jgi:hypothetical protein
MRNPSAVLKKLGACLKIKGSLIPGVDLAGTVPCGPSGLVAILSGAKAQEQSPTPSLDPVLVFVLMKPKSLF